MFELDKWQEIYATIRKNWLRTILTAFSVAWGIFMLMILLGSGNGLRNGFIQDFNDDAVNSIWISPGQTSISYNGLKSGRRVHFETEDYEHFKDWIDTNDKISARFNRWNMLCTYGKKTGTFEMRSTHPDHVYLENTLITEGRYINEKDLAEYRKVTCIGEAVVEQLFGLTDPIGKYINIGGIPFKVVGIFTDQGNDGELQKVYTPITTAQKVYSRPNRIDQIMFTIGDASVEESKEIADEAKAILAQRHNFSIEDPRAIWIRNMTESFEMIMQVLGGISLFIWIIGIGTLVAGVIGVSNIMLIVVKERTREIGIRKALGASPNSIVGLIMMEAVVITTIAGYFGMVSGVFLLEFIQQFTPEKGKFVNPEVSLDIALTATSLLILAGAIAGYLPARRAAKVEPIAALREE